MSILSNRIGPSAPRNNRAGRQPATPVKPQLQQANTLSNYGTTTKIRSLYPGQIVKGEVSDLRNNEVMVTLENNTVVAGKLLNGSWLAIGEIAAFKVASASQENIVLEALTRTDMTLANSTIQKALEEAGLPKNERNQQIVLELMNNQLPINKQAILQTLQLSLQNKEIKVPTLVLMNKLNMPITLENANQFEQYQSNQHALANKLFDISQQATTFVKELAALGTETNSNTFQAPVAKLISTMLDTPIPGNNFTKNLLPDLPLQLDEVEKESLLSVLDTFDFPEDIRQAISNDQASLRSVMQLVHKDFAIAYQNDLDIEMTEAEAPTRDTVTKEASTTEPITMHTTLLEADVIRKLEFQFKQLQITSNELGGKMDFTTRQEFSALLEPLPLDSSIKQGVSSGEINVSELLRTIKNVLPFSESQPTAQLLCSDSFTQLLEEEFTSSLFLTPELILQKDGVNHYYQHISKQIEDLEDLLEQNKTLTDALQHSQIEDSSSSLKNTVSQAKNNLDFMKLLNQFFSYVQLPVNLREKCTHADLYVYTKKKTLAKQNNPIRVLLRLDLEHLGALDINVELNNKNVTAKFAVNNDKAIKLIDINKDLLEDALLAKGYLCNVSVEKLEKEVDLIKDFIEDAPSAGLSRYSFDLRA